MASLRVVDIPKSINASDNVFGHNPNHNHSNVYMRIKVGDIIITYNSIPNKDVPEGCVAINRVIRNHYKIALNDEIRYTRPAIGSIASSAANLNISLKLYIPKDVVAINETLISDHIVTRLQGTYLFPTQLLFFNFQNHKIIGLVSNYEGFVTKNTIINIISSDSKLVLSSSSLLKRDFFKDDFSFESIGIGGLDKKLKVAFQQALSTRAISSDIIKKMGIRHIRGILLFGPPGTGKTLIARKIAGLLSDIEPKLVNGPEIMNKFVGQSEENIRNLFADAIADRHNDNLHIIIFDEIDAICKTRGSSSSSTGVGDTIVNQLLTMIDGVNPIDNIFVIGMTNRKDMIDPALLRAGRLEIHLEIGLPDTDGREQILRIHTSGVASHGMLKDVDLKMLALSTHNYTGAELESLVNRAVSNAIHEQVVSDKDKITESDIVILYKHFNNALKTFVPSYGIQGFGNIIPDRIIPDISQKHIDVRNSCTHYLLTAVANRRVLLYGDNGTGKSVLAAQIGIAYGAGNIRYINSQDVMSMDDNTRFNHINKYTNDCLLAEDSILIIDDMEVIISYSTIGRVVSYSNRILQLIISILKINPEKGKRFGVLCIFSDAELVDTLSTYFDRVYNIGKMDNGYTIRQNIVNSKI